ncbi:MAG: hypothetical protein H6R05_177 [Burkholderiaceae bacterium]|nr:hypothetical protein [Burkholderiaceae bacterium]
MGTTYSWHQGVVRLKSKWAVPTPLLPDEIFSSWLVRVAFANGLEPMALTGSLWAKSRLWTIDIDRHLSQSQIATIAEYSGMSQQQISKSLLPCVSDKYTTNIGTKEPAIAPWILALGSRSRKRYGGMQYCPKCLAEDEISYFRINWRFAWHTCCLKHSCVLLDRCPHCKSAIQFHKRTYQTPSMRHCAVCNGDLIENDLQVAPNLAMQLQDTADQVLLLGDSSKSVDYFLRLRMFELLVRRHLLSNHQAINKLCNLVELHSNDAFQFTPLGLAFEILSTEERLLYLDMIQTFMGLSDDTLTHHLMSAGLTQQALCPSPIVIPESLQHIFNQLPNAQRNTKQVRSSAELFEIPPPRSEKQVMRTFERLKRKIRAL